MINAGMVSVENGRKDGGPNDYVPTKKVRVELSFVVETPEQAEATLDRVLTVAQSRVQTALWGVAAKPVTLGEQIAHSMQEANAAADLAKVKDAEFTAKIKERIAAEKEAAVKEPAKNTDAIVLDTALPAELKREQPAKQLDAATIIEPPKAAEAPKTTGAISDADIMKAITTTNAQVKNAKAITALIKKHTADLAPEKQTASNIPGDRRAAFVDDLELLKVSGPVVA